MEELVLQKRRRILESDIEKNPYNYDHWFDLISLEEQASKIDNEVIRQIYERAVLNIPQGTKVEWKRYIFLWLNYALFEEVTANDNQKAKLIFERVLKLIPHQNFTFSKVWLAYAQFHIRRQDLSAARMLLGQALGKCPTKKIFRFYSDLEF